MEHLKLAIRGMTCEHCARAVRQALSAAGAAKADVSVGAAEVDYDPARVTPQDLMRAIEEEGYAASRA